MNAELRVSELEDELRSVRGELDRVRGELDRRVAERTEELRSAVKALYAELAERGLAEEALRRSEERYSLAVLGANDGIWDRDLLTGNVYFSPRWKRMIGYEDHEIENRFDEWHSRIHPEDVERVLNYQQRYLDGDLPTYELEYRLRHRDGSYRWLLTRGACFRNSDGQAYRLAGSHTDITDRKASQEKYRTLFEESRDGIYIMSAAGSLLDANPALCSLLGYSREEILELDMGADVCREENDLLLLRRLTERDGYVKDFEMELARKDGETITVYASASVILDRVGRADGHWGIVHDVSDRKRLQEQLLQAQKMESIGLLAGGIAHDFNNMLTAITGYAQLLQENVAEDDETTAHAVERILTASDRAVSLTRNLLAFSRKQIINPKLIALNDVVYRMAEMCSMIVKEDIGFVIDIEDECLMALADSGQIEQVLVNLVTNACDAMPLGGTITVSAGKVVLCEDCDGLCFDADPGVYTRISVSDTGIGMDEPTIHKIFEPFFTTKEMGRGTGLGLSIIYGIIRQHNGNIRVLSVPGEGSVFEIYLPVAAAGASEQAAETEERAEGGDETILVVEDDDVVRSFLIDVLAGAGYTVIGAVDGEDALERFRNDGCNVDLVLTDVVMPRKNGLDAYREMDRLRSGVPVIFASGYTADIIHKKGILEEGLDYITKPVRKNRLLAKVREVLDRGTEPEGFLSCA